MRVINKIAQKGYKMIKSSKLVTILSAVAMLALLSGCGGDDDNGDDDNQISVGTLSSLPSSYTEPLVAYSASDSRVFNGKTYTRKIGADGDFKTVANTFDVEFDASVSTPYTITTLTRTEAVDITEASSEHILATVTYDFNAGTEHFKGTSSVNGTIDCVNTYMTPLPLLISFTDEIPEYFDDSTLSSTTCPNWINEDDNSEPLSFTGVFNTTINGTSHISTYQSF